MGSLFLFVATPCKTAGTRISEVSGSPCKAFCCFRHTSHKKGALKTKVFYSISAVGKRIISFSYHQIYGGFMKRIILGFMLLALSGCGSGGSKTAGVPDGTPLGALNSSAAKSTPLAAGDTDCPTGGILVQTGIDKNGNGTLDASEVTSSQKVCNGAQGATGTTGITGAAGVTGAIGPQGAMEGLPPPPAQNLNRPYMSNLWLSFHPYGSDRVCRIIYSLPSPEKLLCCFISSLRRITSACR